MIPGGQEMPRPQFAGVDKLAFGVRHVVLRAVCLVQQMQYDTYPASHFGQVPEATLQ
jgi:hypothetical protein